MKIVFMGTPDFAVVALEELKKHHEVAAVVTQPDKKKGRGKAVSFPPVKEKAIELDIPVYQPPKVRDEEFVSFLRELNPDCIVVAAFGQILPENILAIPKYGCINIHASLLPKYRGAAPIQWSIIDGEEKTGVTTMYMAKGLDTGDMLLKEEVVIEPKENANTLHDKLARVGANLILKTLEGLESGEIERKVQDDSLSCYASMIHKDLGKIDWSAKTAREIERLVRGLYEWPSAYTYFKGKILKIWDADVCEGSTKFQPGQVIEVTKKGIAVQCKEDALLLNEVQLQGKKRMAMQAFLLGNKIQVGDFLGENDG